MIHNKYLVKKKPKHVMTLSTVFTRYLAVHKHSISERDDPQGKEAGINRAVTVMMWLAC